MPALTGEFLFPCFVEPEETGSSLPDLARSAAARSCKARFYCFDALACHSGEMLHDSATWGDLGRPQALQVVRKPEARRLSADLINAIEASDVGGVRRILTKDKTVSLQTLRSLSMKPLMCMRPMVPPTTQRVLV